MSARELNFDGLPGPTHHYAGLSPGNLASADSAGRRSHPRAAALQGLAKMALLHRLGVAQAVIPPQPRPDLDWLRRLGFAGSDARVVERAGKEAPQLLAAAYSASSMWTANAATVMPSADTADGRVHIVPANLSSELHRGIEPAWTSRLLRALLPDERLFVHHDPTPIPGDEGAANHTRLCRDHGAPGLELFVFGRPRSAAPGTGPRRYPARQSEEASRAVARVAGLDPSRTFFVAQSPTAIDAGVFHNDVIATGDRSLLLLHEAAWVEQHRVLEELREAFARHCGEGGGGGDGDGDGDGNDGALRVVEISNDALPLSRAVATYLFNCQIVALPDGRVAWIGPVECEEDAEANALLQGLAAPDGPFDVLHFVDLRESMRNGGGPACLRLRVVLRDDELAAVHPGALFDAALHARLERVVEKHYRESLEPRDLVDPDLITESRAAVDAVMEALSLPDHALPDHALADRGLAGHALPDHGPTR